MTDPGVNVTTVDDIPYDKLLGPLPVISNIMDTMVMIGLRCSEMRPVTQQLKIDPKEMENLTSSRHFHWLFYIQSARDEVEQNLEVITKHSQLYYRVIRNVSAGEELFVWYSKESAQIYKVPDVDEFYDKDDRKYGCPYCSEAFLFPNPFKAHLMYRCEMRLAEVHGLSTVNRLQLDSINRLQLDLYSSAAAMLPSVKSGVTLKGLSITSLANSFLDIYRRTTSATVATSAATTTTTTMTKENCTTDEHDDGDDHRHHHHHQYAYNSRCHVINRADHQMLIKRKIDSHLVSEHVVGIKRSMRTNNNNNGDHLMSNGRSSKTGASQKAASSIGEFAAHQGPRMAHHNHPKKSISPNNSSDLETSGSAFKKVNKSCRDRSLSPSNMGNYNPCDPLGQTMGKPLYHHHHHHHPISYSLPLTSTGSPPAAVMAITAGAALACTPSGWSVPRMTSDQTQTQQQHQQHQQSFHASKLMDVGSSLYVNAAGGLKRSSSAVSPTTGELAAGNNVDPSASAIYPDSIYRLSVSLPYGGKQFGTPLDNFMLTSKLPPPPSQPPPCPPPPCPPPPSLPPPPPIAASLLPPSLAALAFPAQNWCAKCNASFRMTSDLVYHMRSHHKREVDPMKKKREEKLKCSICSESFRERHHLTRHMTSHQ